MSHEDKTSQRPEESIEARIVAWVLGEASAFEAQVLEKLIAEDPALEIFKRRMQAVHGLLAQNAAAEKMPLRLSEERRRKLFETIGTPAKLEGASAVPVPIPSHAAVLKREKKMTDWRTVLAACLTLGIFLAAMAVPSFQKIRRYSESKRAPEVTTYSMIETKPVSEPMESVDVPLSADMAVPTLVARSSAIEMPRLSYERQELKKAMTERYAAPRNIDVITAQDVGKFPNTNVAESLSPISGATVDRLYAKQDFRRKQEAAETFEEQTAGRKGQITDGGIAQQAGADNAYRLPEKSVTGYQQSLETGLSEKRNSLQNIDVITAQDVGRFPDRKQAAADVFAERVAGREKQASDKKAETQADASEAAAAPPDSSTGGAIELPNVTVNGNSQSLEKSLSEKREVDESVDTPATFNRAAKLIPPSADVLSGRSETSASKDAVSTFSFHVSDASFRLAQSQLAQGGTPDPDSIRPEEFYNAFDYGDPAPLTGEKVSCRIEQAAHPFLQQRNLIRVAMKVSSSGLSKEQALRLTVLLDTSGSMEREDRALAVRAAMKSLASLLRPGDLVTLIGFSRQPRLLAENISAQNAGQLVEIVAHTPPQDGTNLEEAIKLGGEISRRQKLDSAQNRIVLMTDGAANLGDSNPEELSEMVQKLRQEGITFDACGVGIDANGDTMLEALTRKGNGRYYLLRSAEEADAGFAKQLAGDLHPAAENVKVQVRFNPARIGQYKLIGFEKHRLKQEDFRNDAVSAAELAADEAAVALYQVQVLPQGDGELGEVYVRFRDTSTGAMVERSWTLPYDPYPAAFSRATPAIQLAGTAALLAQKLQGGADGDSVRLAELLPVVNQLRGRFAHEPKVQQLITMFAQMQSMYGETPNSGK